MLDFWLRDHNGRHVQVKSLEELGDPKKKRVRKTWLINKLPESKFEPIGLSVDLLEKLGCPLEETSSKIRIHIIDQASDIPFYLDFMLKEGQDWKVGYFVPMDSVYNLDDVHELQRKYYQKTGKHLKLSL